MTLKTNLSPKELLVHFADQLPAQEWALEDEALSNTIAVQTWSLDDDRASTGMGYCQSWHWDVIKRCAKFPFGSQGEHRYGRL